MELFLLSFATFLSSSVVGGLIAGFVTLRRGERKIQIENVTQERAKWRNKIRAKALEVHHAANSGNSDDLAELVLNFALNLNPLDEEDRAILMVIKSFSIQENQKEKLDEFSDRVSLLLKHDWDRAKHEAKPGIFWWRKPRRTTFAQFKANSTFEQNATHPAT